MRAFLVDGLPVGLPPVRVVLFDGIPVGLPPVRVVLVDDMEDVPALEGDAQLMAGDVEVVIRHVGEVCAVVVHRLALLLFYFILDQSYLIM